jgi:antitoxin VapB
MAINIKNPDVEAAIRKLASQLGVDLTEAVSCAVRHELERKQQATTARLARMRSISDHLIGVPVRDARSADEILGYDERGIPS